MTTKEKVRNIYDISKPRWIQWRKDFVRKYFYQDPNMCGTNCDCELFAHFYKISFFLQNIEKMCQNSQLVPHMLQS